tara:strand:+ start:159 stop:476 length:318 start_codon:yes stop_codon:yes gene_type:complete
MKPQIKLHDHYEFTSITRIYDIKNDFCTARVSVYAMVDSDNNVEITDSEVEFYLNGKLCNHRGFKELYVSLFSEFDFNNYYQSLCKQAGDAIHNHYTRLKNLEKI